MNQGAIAIGPGYERCFKVQAHEMGPGGRAKLGSLLNYFQEAASEHAERLGASVLDLISKNLTWVLSRYHIKIFRYPLRNESFRIQDQNIDGVTKIVERKQCLAKIFAAMRRKKTGYILKQHKGRAPFAHLF